MSLNNLSDEQLALILTIAIWDIAWKGFALWKAARNESKGWFIAILIVNSAGILPILYLLLNKNPKQADRS